MEPGRGDLEWGTVPRLVDASAHRFGDAVAFVDGDDEYTFIRLAHETRRWTKAMMAAGVAPGDRVAIWAPNSARWMLSALGALCAGAIVVPINTRFKGDEAAYVLQKSRARLLCTVNGFLGIDYVELLRAADAAPDPTLAIVLIDGALPPGTIDWTTFVEQGASISDADVERRMASVTATDVADIMFTSGTTGRPKGAMITHGQNMRVLSVYTDAIGLREGDRYLIVNPFFHSFGYKAGWMSCIMRGATAFTQAVFDVDTILERISTERISVLPGPPTVLHSMLDHPRRSQFDLHSLRLTVTGAATIPVELIRRLRDEHLFDVVLTAYGLTEASAVVSVSQPDDDPETIANWSGRVIPDIEVRVVDDAGHDVPTGDPGELLIRGYNVMKGYFEDPEATAEAIDAAGWLHTGDIAIVNDHRYVRITDRKKDMFIVGGFNAYPAEIENLLLGCEKIAQVAVVGAPDDRMGEVGAAFVVLRPAAALTADEVIGYARAHMANYKVPRYIEIVAALPVNASGKVIKYELRERARSLATKGE